MHFDFHFTAVEILWTLTFAAMLVLLVVLLGRERIRRFPFFTASVILIGIDMLVQKLLTSRIAPLRSTEISLALADLGVVVSLLVAVELARRAFAGARWPAWVAGSVVLLGGAAAVIAFWGSWPPAKAVFDSSMLGHLRLMQLFAQKGDLFNEALSVELFALVVVVGRRFKTGWRSHTQQILAGLSTNSAMLIVSRIIWESMIRNAPRTEAEYQKLMDLQSHLLSANGVALLVVMLWWIVCLWIDEPSATPPGLPAAQEAATPAAEPAETLEPLIGKPAEAPIPPEA